MIQPVCQKQRVIIPLNPFLWLENNISPPPSSGYKNASCSQLECQRITQIRDNYSTWDIGSLSPPNRILKRKCVDVEAPSCSDETDKYEWQQVGIAVPTKSSIKLSSVYSYIASWANSPDFLLLRLPLKIPRLKRSNKRSVVEGTRMGKSVFTRSHSNSCNWGRDVL